MNSHSPHLTNLCLSRYGSFQKLKAKYSGNNGGINEKGDIFRNVTGIEPSQARDKAEHVQASYQKLNQYRTCDACLGRGLIKSVYNFMVLESNCVKCDSEGVLRETAAFISGDSPLEEKKAEDKEKEKEKGTGAIAASTSAGIAETERIADQVDPALGEGEEAQIVPTSAITKAATAPPSAGPAATAAAAATPSTRDSNVDVDALLSNDTVD